LAPTVGLLTASAGAKFRTRPFTSSGERIVHGLVRAPCTTNRAGCDVAPGSDVACPAGCFIVPFGSLRVFVALVPDVFPGEVRVFADSPVPVSCVVPADVTALRIRAEVLTIGTSAGSPHAKEKAAAAAAALAAAPPRRADPLHDTIRSLQAPITPDADAAAAATHLNEDHQQLLLEATALAATRRQLESSQRGYDSAHGLTPPTAEPSRVAEVRIRGGALGRALGAGRPVYDTPVKNMCAA